MTQRICVIGNFSGRNAGDAAILDGLMNEIYALNPDVVFDVPTINTGFVNRSYPGLPVEPRGMMPWNLSVKIFGWPILASILKSDVVLVTDAILFDRKLLNPLYNYLSTMALVLPLAKKWGKPIILYNVSLGPVTFKLGRTCMDKVLKASDKVVLRDRESLRMLDAQKLSHPAISEGADSALNIVPTEGDALDQIFLKEKLCPEGEQFITVNINSYLDVFLQREESTQAEDFVGLMAGVLDRLIETLGIRVVFVETQPMDLKLANQVYDAVKNQDKITMITNVDYSHRDLTGVFARAQYHIGMRTHSLILASSVHTPVVGIICTPKNRGYMGSIDQEAQMIEFDNFTSETLFDICERTWHNREKLREDFATIIPREKAKAKTYATVGAEFLPATKAE